TEIHGKHSSSYSQTVLSIEVSKLTFPEFTLAPENVLHKIMQFMGGQDIDFESFPVFSKKYLLVSSEEAKIRELFTPEMIKYFEANQGLHIECQGNILILYKQKKRSDPSEIKAFYQDGESALSNFMSIK
ncbi:MAG: hypothetical protein KAI17_12270, partial [Thiotrichaceae bacterium]|nr:hypothetical protein [Thiotrichaceae bacterium]